MTGIQFHFVAVAQRWIDLRTERPTSNKSPWPIRRRGLRCIWPPVILDHRGDRRIRKRSNLSFSAQDEDAADEQQKDPKRLDRTWHYIEGTIVSASYASIIFSQEAHQAPTNVQDEQLASSEPRQPPSRLPRQTKSSNRNAVQSMELTRP